jgi:hypothetical protein
MELCQCFQLVGTFLNFIGSVLLVNMARLRKDTIDKEIEVIATIGSAPIIESTAKVFESLMAETLPKKEEEVDELTLDWETEEGRKELKKALAEDRERIQGILESFQDRLMSERRQTMWGLAFLIIGFLLLLIGQFACFLS